MSILRSNKHTSINVPVYIDGVFELFKLITNDKIRKEPYLKTTGIKMQYRETQIGSLYRLEVAVRDVELTMRIEIPQSREIDNLSVLKIGDSFHKVYEVKHFTNKDGFKVTDLTLQGSKITKVEDEI